MRVGAIVGLVAALLLPVSSNAATVIFNFSTLEPFVGGGLVSFTLEADGPLPQRGFIDARALTSYSPGVARVRFNDACFTFLPGASSSVACDVVDVFVNSPFGTTQVTRLMQDGALSTIGTYTNVSPNSLPAYMVVSSGTAAVPEAETWAMLVVGFAVTGATMRRRRKKVFAVEHTPAVNLP